MGNCHNCNGPLSQGLTDWHWRCTACGLEQSTLAPSAPDHIDEAARATGLESLRRDNFEAAIALLQRAGVASGRLLDVGCAHGWFLDAAQAAGYAVTGIEPDTAVASEAEARGHRVLPGLFPEATDESFDVIAFNDVIEHIPGVDNTLRHVAERLTPGGALVVTVPSSRGVFYRIGKVLARVGMQGPFDRLWQKHFSSPHLYYFNADILAGLAERQGLRLAQQQTLPSVRVRGLWARLNYDRTSSAVVNAALFVAVALAVPVLRLLPADIDLLVFQKA